MENDIWYKLDPADHSAVPCGREDICTGATFEKERRVALTEYKGVKVSTVFLSIDHGHGGPSLAPVLFETLVFGGKYDQMMQRYCTWDEAIEGHKVVCDEVFAWRLTPPGEET